MFQKQGVMFVTVHVVANLSIARESQADTSHHNLRTPWRARMAAHFNCSCAM